MSNTSEISADARNTVADVLKRDRRRIRSWAALAIGLWVVSALLIAAVYLPVGAKVKRYAQMMDAANPGAADVILRDNAPPPSLTPPTPEQMPAEVARLRHNHWIIAQIVFHEWIVGAIILTFALLTGFLASSATVALAFSIRRSTLSQLTQQLTEISAQLRQLQHRTP